MLVSVVLPEGPVQLVDRFTSACLSHPVDRETIRFVALAKELEDVLDLQPLASGFVLDLKAINEVVMSRVKVKSSVLSEGDVVTKVQSTEPPPSDWPSRATTTG